MLLKTSSYPIRKPRRITVSSWPNKDSANRGVYARPRTGAKSVLSEFTPELLTVNGVSLALVKQARDLSGAVLPGGSNVMSGQTIYFALYVDNVTGVTASLVPLLAGEPIPFRLDGTVGIDAGPLGQPSFGPSTWLRGELDISGQPRSNSSRIGFPLPSFVTYTGRFSTT